MKATCFRGSHEDDSIVRSLIVEPAEDDSDKILLAARQMRRATSTCFLISLVADEFSRASNTYVRELSSQYMTANLQMMLQFRTGAYTVEDLMPSKFLQNCLLMTTAVSF